MRQFLVFFFQTHLFRSQIPLTFLCRCLCSAFVGLLVLFPPFLLVLQGLHSTHLKISFYVQGSLLFSNTARSTLILSTNAPFFHRLQNYNTLCLDVLHRNSEPEVRN